MKSLADDLLERGVITAERRDALAAAPATPWWLAVLLALAAWVASLVIMGSFFGPLLAMGDGPATRGVGGLVLLGGALALFRMPGPFLQQMALAFSLAGQGLLASAVLGDSGWLNEGRSMALSLLLISLAMLAPRSSSGHRVVCVLIALSCLGYLIGQGSGLVLFGGSLAALASGLWLSRARWAGHAAAGHLKPLAHGASLAALLLAAYGSPSLDLLLGRGDGTPSGLLYGILAGGVLLATTGWLSREAPGGRRLLLLVLALAFALTAHRAPGLLVAGALLLASFQAGHRAWVGLSLLGAALYLGELYFSLHMTLLAKSLALMGSGALLLAARLVLARLPEDRP